MSRERGLASILVVHIGALSQGGATGTIPAEARLQLQRWRHEAELLLARGGAIHAKSNNSITTIFAGELPAEMGARAVRAAMDVKASSLAPKSVQVAVHIAEPAQFGSVPSHELEFTTRLAQSAPPGGVVLSQDLYRLVYGLFDVQALPALEAAGSIPAYLVLRQRPHWLTRTLQGVEGFEPLMVGRLRELDSLKAAFTGAVEKRECQLVTVVADAGLGKSRLLREFQRWLQTIPYRASLFCGRAEPTTTVLPFSLIRDVFRSRFEILSSDPVSIAGQKFAQGLEDLVRPSPNGPKVQARKIGQLLGFDFHSEEGTTSQQTRHEVFHSLSDLFLSLNTTGTSIAADQNSSSRISDAPGAAVLVLEDVHWSDDDSLDLIAHLAKSCQKCPFLILALARPGLLERRPAWFELGASHLRLGLDPLSSRESLLLIETILSRSGLPSPLCEMILAGAGGNPFYIEEIIRVLIEKQVIVPAPGECRFQPDRLALAPASPSLSAVLRARLEALPLAQRELLQAASVVGHVFWDDALGWLTARAVPAQPKELQQDLAELCRKDLIQRRESSGFAGAIEYAFKHELLRDVTCEGLSKPLRHQYHSRVASWFVERGGERINELAGLVAVHFEQAFLLPQAADWYGRAGRQAQTGYAPAAAFEYFQKALRLLPTNGHSTSEQQRKRLEWQEGLSETLTTQGRFAEALASFRQLCALAESANDTVLLTRAWNGLAFLHERRGDNRASIEAADRAAILAQLSAQGHRYLIRALHLKGWAYYRLGDSQKVLALAAETFKLCQNSAERGLLAISLKLYGVAHLQLGQYAEADRYFQDGLALCLETGDHRNAAAMFSNLGESARLRGDFALAVELYQKALQLARQIGERPSEMIYLSNLGGARLGLGQFGDAETDLRQAIALTGMSKSCSLSETYTFLASACLGQGKLADALDAAQEAVIIGQKSEILLDLAGAWRVLGQVLATMARAGATPNLQPSLCYASRRDPSDCFAESVRLYESIDARHQQASTLLAWADLERGQGRSDLASEKSSRAQQILAGLATAGRLGR